MKIYSPIHGGEELIGENVKNIEIPDIPHNLLCADSTIKKGKYKGKHITSLVTLLLKD